MELLLQEELIWFRRYSVIFTFISYMNCFVIFAIHLFITCFRTSIGKSWSRNFTYRSLTFQNCLCLIFLAMRAFWIHTAFVWILGLSLLSTQTDSSSLSLQFPHQECVVNISTCLIGLLWRLDLLNHVKYWTECLACDKCLLNVSYC